MARNPLPFQFLVRGNSMQYLDGHDQAAAVESRDVDLEDYLGRLQPGAWGTFFGTAGWMNYSGGWATAQIRKTGDVVEARGLIVYTPTAAAGTLTIGTLPAGYRPPGNVMFPCVGGQVGGPTQEMFRVDVPTTGIVVVQLGRSGALNYLSLDSIRFSVTP
jgi:hypothetical protein